MTSSSDEPTSRTAIAAWIAEQTRTHDRYSSVFDASERHRVEHGADCDVYPSSSGPLLGTLVAAAGASRMLEIGCGLGYSALWLADGAGPGGTVETCEKSALHADLAQRHFDGHEVGARITIRAGRGIDVLAAAHGEYDFIFADGDPDEYLADLQHFMRLLKVGGALVTSNLFLGVYLPDAPWLADAAEYRRRILDDPRLHTVFFPEGKALSVRIA